MALPTLKAEAVLGLCSGRTQYSAQSPQWTAGGRNTTPLSHLADVPVLLYSLPHFLPPSLPLSLSGSISNSCPIPMGQWGVFLCVCGADERPFIVCKRQGGARRGGKRRRGCRGWRKTKINTQKSKAREREGETDGEKLGPASEYNQFSYEPSSPLSAASTTHIHCVFL